MTFRTYFEAKENDMELIKSAIEKVEDRPFKDLFGDKDRFLVKVYNPDFTQCLEDLDLDRKRFDFRNRTYDGNPLGPFFRDLRDDFKKGEWSEEDMYARIRNTDSHDNAVDMLRDHEFTMTKMNDALDIEAHRPGKKPWHVGVFLRKHKNFKPIEGQDAWRNLLMNMFLFHRDFVSQEYKLTQYAKESEYIIDRHSNNKEIKAASKAKQILDQNNVFFYLLFSRHPIDVLRMSDHKGVSSCHRLDGGMYKHCAIADAQNDGGVIYLVKGSAGQRLSQRLDEKEVFEDAHRKVDGVRPLGRTRLRRFIDLQTGEDFATLARLSEQFGLFSQDLWDTANSYIRKNQSIFSNPPKVDYAQHNIVMAGGTYTDGESPAEMMQKFFGKDDYSTNSYKDIRTQQEDGVSEKEQLRNEMNAVIELYEDELNAWGFTVSWDNNDGHLNFNLQYGKDISYDDLAGLVTFPDQLVFDPASNKLHKFLDDHKIDIGREFIALFQIYDTPFTYTNVAKDHVSFSFLHEGRFHDPDDVNRFLSRVVRKFKGITSIWEDLFEEGRDYWTTETK